MMVALVEAIESMDNLAFCEHMDECHQGEYLGAALADMPELADCWVMLYRIIHDRNHDQATRADRSAYNHEHLF